VGKKKTTAAVAAQLARPIRLKGFPQAPAVSDQKKQQASTPGFRIAIPPALLRAISEEASLKAARTQIPTSESELSGECHRHHTVAVWHGRLIASASLLQDLPMPDAKVLAEVLGETQNLARAEYVLRIAKQRVFPFSKIALGYAGWLLTTPAFLDEHDRLLARWKSTIQHRTSFRGAALLPELGARQELEGCDDPPGFVEDVIRFLIRWRLRKLSGPELPEPLMPMLAGQFPVSIVQQLLDAGGLFNIPDTFPIPSRDELRGILQEAVQSADDSHLTEWKKIVHAKNPAKNQIDRFARVRQLYCYWRCLHQRHSDCLYRKADALRRVFAAFLNASVRSIGSDLNLIARRLGRDWVQRSIPA
jgi:hypothetical protein